MPLFPRALATFALAAALSLASTEAKAADPDPIAISANDQMKFDVTDITAAVGQTLTITLTNDGSLPKAAMAHNLVILKPGADTAGFLAAAAKRAADDYIPGDDQIASMIIHTKLLGPGDQDTITFTPDAAGVYEYVCTFPAHAGAGMRGRINVSADAK